MFVLWSLSVLGLIVNSVLSLLFVTLAPLIVFGVFADVVCSDVVQRYTKGMLTRTVQNMILVLDTTANYVMAPLFVYAAGRIQQLFENALKAQAFARIALRVQQQKNQQDGAPLAAPMFRDLEDEDEDADKDKDEDADKDKDGDVDGAGKEKAEERASVQRKLDLFSRLKNDYCTIGHKHRRTSLPGVRPIRRKPHTPCPSLSDVAAVANLQQQQQQKQLGSSKGWSKMVLQPLHETPVSFTDCTSAAEEFALSLAEQMQQQQEEKKHEPTPGPEEESQEEKKKPEAPAPDPTPLVTEPAIFVFSPKP